MKAAILVGDKGERLMPLPQNTRKAYLPLGNKRVVDHIIDRLPRDVPYSISENDSGAIAAVAEALKGNEPVMVICGDNYFSNSLDGFAKAYDGVMLVAVYDVKDLELAKRYGVVEIYPSGRIRDFIEKPEHPRSTLVSTGIYIFPPVLFDGVRKYSEVAPNRQLGDLVRRIIFYHPVETFILGGIWIDIGTSESYRKALELVKGEK